MEYNGSNWHIYKISHCNNFEVINLKKKKRCLTTEPKVHNCVNILTMIIIIFLQDMEIWKIEITKLFISVVFFSPTNHFIRKLSDLRISFLQLIYV